MRRMAEGDRTRWANPGLYGSWSKMIADSARWRYTRAARRFTGIVPTPSPKLVRKASRTSSTLGARGETKRARVAVSSQFQAGHRDSWRFLASITGSGRPQVQVNEEFLWFGRRGLVVATTAFCWPPGRQLDILHAALPIGPASLCEHNPNLAVGLSLSPRASWSGIIGAVRATYGAQTNVASIFLRSRDILVGLASLLTAAPMFPHCHQRWFRQSPTRGGSSRRSPNQAVHQGRRNGVEVAALPTPRPRLRRMRLVIRRRAERQPPWPHQPCLSPDNTEERDCSTLLPF